MPSYVFRNTQNKKEITLFFKNISDYEEFKSEHPHMEQIPGGINIGDPMLLRRIKPSGEFRERLQEIKHSHRGSNINVV